MPRSTFHVGQRRTSLAVEQLPCEHDLPPQRAAGLFMIVFGLLFGGFPLVAFIGGLMQRGFELPMLFVLLFVAAGGGVLAGGLYLFTCRKRWSFTPEEVRYSSDSIFGHKEWAEPLTAYQGIEQRPEQRSSGGKNSNTYTVYVVRLRHPDSKRCVQLYESRDPRAVRGPWENACRVFNLPAVTAGAGGELIRRDVVDLDKSVAELHAEGKLDLKPVDAASAPSRLAVVERFNGVRITVTGWSRQEFIGSTVFLAMGTGAFYAGFHIEQVPPFVGYIGCVLLALFGFGLLWLIFASRRIYVSAGEVRTCWSLPFGETRGKRLPAGQIEEVKISQTRNNQRCLRVETDNDSLELLASHSPETLAWLRDYILSRMLSR